MSYTVLARNMAAKTFEDVIGQPTLSPPQERDAPGRIAHAYLFSGPRGVGKPR